MERFNYIFRACYPWGKILNIGCTGDEDTFDETWHGKIPLHRLLTHSSHEGVVGIDVNIEGLMVMERLGYEVYQENAENITEKFLEANKEKFNFIVAGEIIEHLQDLKSFLQGIRKLLTPTGRLVLTTPNPYGASAIAQHLLGIPEKKWVSPYHTCWFTPLVLKKLLSDNKFYVIDLQYLDVDRNIRSDRKLKRMKQIVEKGRLKPIIGIIAGKDNGED